MEWSFKTGLLATRQGKLAFQRRRKITFVIAFMVTTLTKCVIGTQLVADNGCSLSDTEMFKLLYHKQSGSQFNGNGSGEVIDHLSDSCRTSSSLETSHKIVGALGSGCLSYAALVEEYESGNKGVIKIPHHQGCRPNGSPSISVLHSLLKGVPSQKRLVCVLQKAVGCPGVVQLQATTCNKGNVVAVLSQCRGKALSRYYGRNRKAILTRMEIASIISQLAAAISCLWKKGLWLADLGKPNILYDRNSRLLCIVDLDGTLVAGSLNLAEVGNIEAEEFVKRRWNSTKAREVKRVDPVCTVAVHVLRLLGRDDVDVDMALNDLMLLAHGSRWVDYWLAYFKSSSTSLVDGEAYKSLSMSLDDVLKQSEALDLFIVKFLNHALDWRFSRRQVALILSTYNGSHELQPSHFLFKLKSSRLPSEPSATVTRVFVVGVSHSGTSILYRTIGNLPGILCVGKNTNIFSNANQTQILQKISDFDERALAADMDGWVEKSTSHIRNVRQITQLLPDARIVFISRNGLDNIASLINRGFKLNQVVHRWVVDNSHILPLLSSDKVIHIKFEEFMNATMVMGVLMAICAHVQQECSESDLILALQPPTKKHMSGPICGSYSNPREKKNDLLQSLLIGGKRNENLHPANLHAREKIGALRSHMMALPWQEVKTQWNHSMSSTMAEYFKNFESACTVMHRLNYVC